MLYLVHACRPLQSTTHAITNASSALGICMINHICLFFCLPAPELDSCPAFLAEQLLPSPHLNAPRSPAGRPYGPHPTPFIIITLSTIAELRPSCPAAPSNPASPTWRSKHVCRPFPAMMPYPPNVPRGLALLQLLLCLLEDLKISSPTPLLDAPCTPAGAGRTPDAALGVVQRPGDGLLQHLSAGKGVRVCVWRSVNPL